MRFFINKIKTMNIKFFMISIFVLSIYFVMFYVLLEKYFIQKVKILPKSFVVLPYVVVHLDFKGAPPKLSYLEYLLPTLKKHGANGLLLEYEDMFPYKGRIANLSSNNCYKKKELSSFIRKAVNLKFEIIPLVQTFGHMEHALKLQEFQHLRENQQFPDSICPSKQGNKELLKDMIFQVVEFHSQIKPLKYIHIGFDEVYNMNQCLDCRIRNITDAQLYIEHLDTVRNIVKDNHRNIIVLFWDDMIRKFNPIHGEVIKQENDLEPVYWNYVPNFEISHINLFKYHQKFKNIWIASAFKGAEGRSATFPNLKNRLSNHFTWINSIINYKFGGEIKNFPFKGIILTGWSRYNHMQPLCELLPVSYPSLVLNLLLIQKFIAGVQPIDDEELANDVEEVYTRYLDGEFETKIGCDYSVNIDDFDGVYCSYNGSDLYRVLRSFTKFNKKTVSQLFNDEEGVFYLQYYLNENYISVKDLPKDIDWCYESLQKLNDFEKSISKAMSPYYDQSVIKEFITYKLFYLKKELQRIRKNLLDAENFTKWNKRPG